VWSVRRRGHGLRLLHRTHGGGADRALFAHRAGHPRAVGWGISGRVSIGLLRKKYEGTSGPSFILRGGALCLTAAGKQVHHL
jgi:hypothetical protein